MTHLVIADDAELPIGRKQTIDLAQESRGTANFNSSAAKYEADPVFRNESAVIARLRPNSTADSVALARRIKQL
jgi:hypothetical protein